MYIYIYIYIYIFANSTWPSTISHLLFWFLSIAVVYIQRVDQARNSHRWRAAQITAGVAAIKSESGTCRWFSDKPKTLVLLVLNVGNGWVAEGCWGLLG